MTPTTVQTDGFGMWALFVFIKQWQCVTRHMITVSRDYHQEHTLYYCILPGRSWGTWTLLFLLHGTGALKQFFNYEGYILQYNKYYNIYIRYICCKVKNSEFDWPAFQLSKENAGILCASHGNIWWWNPSNKSYSIQTMEVQTKTPNLILLKTRWLDCWDSPSSSQLLDQGKNPHFPFVFSSKF